MRASIAAACAAAGRTTAEVQLIAVTKTFPVPDIMLLHELGIDDVGENKDQEAAPKVAACAAAGLALRWHFVGQLQVNKAASVASYAYMVHSVDRMRLVEALGRRAVAGGRQVRCLVQVSLDGTAGRGGADPAEVPGLADAIAERDGLAAGGCHGRRAARPAGQARLRPAPRTRRNGAGRPSRRAGDFGWHER